GVSYTTLDRVEHGVYDDTPVYTVPPGHYFMMGDNRDNSTDSRVLSQVGYVPFENLIGRAEIIFFSIGDGARAWQIWRRPWAVRLADLVRKETGADVARMLELGPAIKLGASELNAGGRRRTAILADICEALIGAVFIDGGYAASAGLIERFWEERMLKPKRSL